MMFMTLALVDRNLIVEKEPTRDKYCTFCKHGGNYHNDIGNPCRKPSTLVGYHLVYAGKVFMYSQEIARLDNNLCGLEAKWYEPSMQFTTPDPAKKKTAEELLAEFKAKQKAKAPVIGVDL